MAINWDIFIDERKAKGQVVGIGALCLVPDTAASLQDDLIKKKNEIESRLGHGIGEIHWKGLDGEKSEVAVQWVNAFFGGPMMFYVKLDAYRKALSVITLTKVLVERLEQSPHVPGGLVRGKTTVHVDYDTATKAWMLIGLMRNFGLLRAFKWHSKGSEIVQLSDLLLGISTTESTGSLPSGTCPTSKSELHRLRVMEHVRDIAKKKSSSFVVVMRADQEQVLFRD